MLERYAAITGPDVIEELKVLASGLSGKSMTHVNSTSVGGGVAEILNRMVPMMKELGLQARWEVIRGGETFYAATKKIHNALHGKRQVLTEDDIRSFIQTQEANLESVSTDADFMLIHDPQPIGLIAKKAGNHWVWRCHVDVSDPDANVWAFLKTYIERYDTAVFSASAFAKKLAIPQVLICPSIDPLSDKNKPLGEDVIKEVLHRLDIPTDRPLVTQVSRFDRLKDPLGVIRAFRLAARRSPARLLLVGGTADDDPEGAQVYAEVMEEASKDPSILIRLLPATAHIEINALQRASTIILQKSIREGFGLTITEALWKSKPVIAGDVGGIPLQILNGQTGILTRSVEETARGIDQLLGDPAFALRLGETGREHVRQNFLLTRHLRDYLRLFLSLIHPGEQAHP